MLAFQPRAVKAAELGVKDDTFEAYSTGDINGQDGWYGSTQYDVVDNFAQAGSKSMLINNSINSYTINVVGTSRQTGIQSVYIYTDDARSGTDNKTYIYLSGDTVPVNLATAGLVYNTGSAEWDYKYQEGNSPYNLITWQTGVSIAEWHLIQYEIDEPNWRFKTNIDNGTWTDWVPFYDYYNPASYSGVEELYIYSSGARFWYDSFGGEIISANSITINSPASGSTASSTFTMDITYNMLGENYNKIMINLESWNVSSTCPAYGTDEWNTEFYTNNWFYSMSFPYYSGQLTTSSEATTSIDIDFLAINNYNCVRCVFINNDFSLISENKCPDYTINTLGYITASQPLPYTNWNNYFAANTDDKFPTSTSIFNTIANVFDNLYRKLTDFLTDFMVLFDNNLATEKGNFFGGKIPEARGYLKPINDLIGGGFPISEMTIFAVSITMMMIVGKIIKTILGLIRG